MSRRSTLLRLTGTAGDESAQALVEFAFISLILLLLFAGTLDFGRFLYYETAVVNVARVGAETAINHCADHFHCSDGTTPISTSLILRNAMCESDSTVPFRTSPTLSCAPSAPSAGTAANCPASGQDICIAGTQAEHQTVTVYVGYDFQPITPIINQFFPTVKCWTQASGAPSDDANAHDLCASATGRIS